MKKLFLAITLIIATFSAKAQSDVVNGRVITHSTATKTMVWSEVDQKNIFFDQQERHPDDNLIETSINTRTATGKITITSIETGDVYNFNIFDYEVRPEQITPDGTKYDTFIIDCIEVNTGAKARIVFMSYQDSSFRMVTVFMAEDQLAVYMDTER